MNILLTIRPLLGLSEWVLPNVFTVLGKILRSWDTKKAAFAAGCMPEINAKKSPVLL